MPHGHLPQVTSINRPTKLSPAHREHFFIETCFAPINQSTDFSHTNSHTNSNISSTQNRNKWTMHSWTRSKCCLCDRCTLYCYFETLYIEMLFLAGSLCTFDLTQSFLPLTQLVQKKILTQLHNRMFYFVLIKVI